MRYKKAFSFKIFLFFIFCLVFFSFSSFVWAANPHLELSPSSGVLSTSGTDIAVKIDTGGQEAKSVRAVIDFSDTELEVTSVTEGTFFDEVSYNIYDDQVLINATLSLGSSLETKTGIGTIATLAVKPIITSGEAEMTFDCTQGSSTDTGINNAVPTDIIVCSSNVNGVYTVGSGTGGTSSSPTPIPSASSSATTTTTTTTGRTTQPAASSLPESGNVGPTVSLVFLGLTSILLLSSMGLVLKRV